MINLLMQNNIKFVDIEKTIFKLIRRVDINNN